MVDDVLCVQKCSTNTVKLNSLINSFIENKKLKLSTKKCHRIHIQSQKDKRKTECQEIKVHENEMQNSNEQKYLGELICSNGSVRNTIEERRNKGYGIVNEIIAIIDEIPLGKFRLEIEA